MISFRRLSVLAGAAVGVACNDSNDPAPGVLDSRIIHGEVQTMTAGESVPNAVIDQVFRRPATTAALPLWERILLPALAFAQNVGIVVQPNSVVCVKQPYGELIPEVPCVNSDAQGQALFTFIEPTKSGTHQAIISATYGIEKTIPDTVSITVKPGPPNPNYRTNSLALQCSPAVFPENGVQDEFGNGIPYRIVSDGRLTVQDTVVGSLGARTVTFTSEYADSVGQTRFFLMDLQIAGGAIGGKLRYRIGTSAQGPGGCHQINWQGYGTAVTP